MIAATDVGQVRKINEDSLTIMPHINLAVVADGMGGHKSGDIASRMAVTSLADYFEGHSMVGGGGNDVTDEIMSDAFTLANSQVYTSSKQLADCAGMGTTLLSCSFQPTKIHVGHIGDSRLYRFDGGRIEQMTTDHTLATELKGVSQQAPELPSYSHHVLCKALGIEAVCSPDFFTIKPQKEQIFLLCSDGLTGMMTDDEIQTTLNLKAHQPESCVESLINTCNENGATDNLSIILIFVK